MTKIYDNHILQPLGWELDIASYTGFTITMIRFAIAFFSSIPIAIMLRNVPTPKSRHWFAAITGFILIYYPFGNGCFHALVPSILTYLAMVNFREHCGTLTWLITFPYLIFNHVLQASGMSWKEGQLDFTGAQMILTLKLISIAMCYQDSARGNENSLREYSKQQKLDRCPSLLEFFSYLFAAGNLLSGPFHEAKDYYDYIERKGDWDESGPHGKIPIPFVPGLYRFFKALVCAAIWHSLTTVAGLNVAFLESKEWRENHSFIMRLALLHVALVGYRFKYYFVWCVSESASIFSGLGFQGYHADGTPKWNRYINSHIRKVELNPSLADTPRHWNIRTGLWLRHYVYERLSPLNKKPSFFNMIVTQLVSGVWHGIFAGYWLFFATSAFMFEASRLIYKYERTWPPQLRGFIPWVLLKVVVSELVLSYAGSAFMVLSFTESILMWRSLYFCGHGLVFALLLVGSVMPPKRVKDQKVDPNKEE